MVAESIVEVEEAGVAEKENNSYYENNTAFADNSRSQRTFDLEICFLTCCFSVFHDIILHLFDM